MNFKNEEVKRIRALLKDIHDTKEYNTLSLMIGSALSHTGDAPNEEVSRKREVLACILEALEGYENPPAEFISAQKTIEKFLEAEI